MSSAVALADASPTSGRPSTASSVAPSTRTRSSCFIVAPALACSHLTANRGGNTTGKRSENAARLASRPRSPPPEGSTHGHRRLPRPCLPGPGLGVRALDLGVHRRPGRARQDRLRGRPLVHPAGRLAGRLPRPQPGHRPPGPAGPLTGPPKEGPAMTDFQPWTSDRPAVGPGTLPAPEFVLQHAARFGDNPALVDGPTGRALTYRQLADGVERVAAALAARGFGKGDVLAISSPNLPEYALALYGAMADAGASLLVTVPPFLETARAAAEKAGVAEVLVFGEADGATPFRDLVAHDHPTARVGVDPARDLAALPYSSGTTGLPKGVELTHANLVANAQQTQGAIEFTADDVVVGVAPFFHAIGQNLILPCSLRAGRRWSPCPASTSPPSSS